jgi:uncharacterized protein (DUF1501 family)
MRRRQFLAQAGIASLASLGLEGWLARTEAAPPASSGRANPQRLVVVFLRGAADGLNVVAPYQDPGYYSARPNLALPKPGTNAGVLDLDGRFGLHPELAGLMPLWQKQQLAFVHACGSNDPSRSHFDAQEFMENGTPGSKASRDGWMNRLLAQLQLNQRPQAEAVSLRQTPPMILRGSRPFANLSLDDQNLRQLPIDQTPVRAAFDPLYQGNDPISRAYREGKAAREELRTALAEDAKENMMANNGAPQAAQFARSTRRLGQLMARDPKIQLAFLDVGGWDTHINQPGRLGQQLRQVSQGLQGFIQALGPVYPQTLIVVMSEFGRTVRENGNRGTDHGHGNVMWLLGGQLKGGKVYGDWPGLGDGSLYEGRDLRITTDFRDVLATTLSRHMRLPAASLTAIFPGYQPRLREYL